MKNCLVTTLKEDMNIENPPYMDYLSFREHTESNPTVNGHTIDLYYKQDYSGNRELKIDGDGFFTDSTLVTNLGKTFTATRKSVSSSSSMIRFSNGNYNLLIPIEGLNCFYPMGFGLTDVSSYLDGFDYSRLFLYNPEIGKVAYKTQDELFATPLDTLKGIVAFGIIKKYNAETDMFNGDKIIQKIVETERTTDFAIQLHSYYDFYGHILGIRNVHITTAGTAYSVYNQANTELLYTAVKSGGAWTYTAAT